MDSSNVPEGVTLFEEHNGRWYESGDLAAIRGAETQLRELYVSAIDRESEHIERDRILLELLDVLAPEIATLVREREDKVGYWYA
jgi:hypothetical protein